MGSAVLADEEKTRLSKVRFHAVQQDEVPRGRAGKHQHTVSLLLHKLDQLPPGQALKIPLTSLPDTKANIRSALNRATHKMGREIATSSDSTYLYLWKVNRIS